MNDAVIISACRTPIGRLLGALAPLPAPQLGALAVGEVVRRAGVAPDAVDEVIMGNVISAGLGQAPARQAALGAGLPPGVGALTVNKVCGSGLKAVMLAAQAVRLGDAQVVVAGGMESMSRAPHLLPGARGGWKLGSREAVDAMLHDGLECAFEKCAMGQHAEHTANSCRISREEQDQFALESHRRAVAAAQAGAFREEIVAVKVSAGRGREQTIDVDEGPRADTTAAALAALRPAFNASGTVTAGNASMISDGAAAVVVTSREHAERLGRPPLATIRAYATAGLEPKELFLAPVPAIQRVLEKAGLTLADIDLFEINEAFAAQVLGCFRKLGLGAADAQRINVHGGAIALGHPIGASGARVLVTLLHVLKQRGARRGLAALCLGGGNAVAMVVEKR